MRVRLTRRLAEHVNGVDLSNRHVGDLIDMLPADAEMMIAEGWATPAKAVRDSADHRPRRAARRKPNPKS